MTIEQVIKLLDNGFTSDEIKQFSNGGTEPAGEPKTSETVGDPKPAEPAGDPKPIETAAFSEAVNALMKEISGLKKTIQATNILNSNADKEEPESVDTILQSFMKGANK